MTPDEIYVKASVLSPDQWLGVLIASTKDPDWKGVLLPRFPEPSLQAGFVGSANEQALKEAYLFYTTIQSYMRRRGLSLNRTSRVLDFGCGWGRYLRFFLRDVPWSNLYGLDAMSLAITTCQETGVYGQLLKIDLLPPTILAGSSMDLVYAYSVFSHLSRLAADAWIEELTRLLRPGGMLFLTTQGRSFLDFCDTLQNEEPEIYWHSLLKKAFTDTETKRDLYDRGEFVHVATGGGVELPGEVYGEALVPKGYVETHWTGALDLVDFVDDRSNLPQALIVLQKKTAAEQQ
jgi:SAM-dependent methyltransferase